MINLELTQEEVVFIHDVVAKYPYEEVADLMAKIKAQFIEQTTNKDSSEECCE